MVILKERNRCQEGNEKLDIETFITQYGGHKVSLIAFCPFSNTMSKAYTQAYDGIIAKSSNYHFISILDSKNRSIVVIHSSEIESIDGYAATGGFVVNIWLKSGGRCNFLVAR